MKMGASAELNQFRNDHGQLQRFHAHCGKSKPLVYRHHDDKIMCWRCANIAEGVLKTAGYEGPIPVRSGGVYQEGPLFKCEFCGLEIKSVKHSYD